jgi:hypothetical protein
LLSYEFLFLCLLHLLQLLLSLLYESFGLLFTSSQLVFQELAFDFTLFKQTVSDLDFADTAVELVLFGFRYGAQILHILPESFCFLLALSQSVAELYLAGLLSLLGC